MSGPIIRKYGFPNHESIFGKKEIEHGKDEQATPSNSEKPVDAKSDKDRSPGPKEA